MWGSHVSLSIIKPCRASGYPGLAWDWHPPGLSRSIPGTPSIGLGLHRFTRVSHYNT